MNARRISDRIWNIAKDLLRGLDGRAGYREIVLPMTLVRRLDDVLRPTRRAVIRKNASLDGASPADRDAALRLVAGEAFYNTSPLALADLGNRPGRQRLAADFNAYLDGFSANVRRIVDEMGLRDLVRRLDEAGVLGETIRQFATGDLNLAPNALRYADGTIVQPGLDDRGMRAVFEELALRCNEEEGERTADRHTPPDAMRLMARLVFEPVARDIPPGSYSIYDGACGTGGLLNQANRSLREAVSGHRKAVSTELYGQEIDAGACAVCKANILLDGARDTVSAIVGGAARSTLSNDAFAGREFDFMLSNPPCGQRWKADLARLGGSKRGVRDPRFTVEHAGEAEFSLVPRASDSQMLFLVNALSKMKRRTLLGSRIAQIHNGASLMTGDAGQGESNIRRWILENDWLEAVVALPGGIFHNTGIAAYVWVLTNRKPARRRGRVQLIDATGWYRSLARGAGRKGRELDEDSIARICETFRAFREDERSRILDNEAFGYRKFTVERPLRIEGADPGRAHSPAEIRAFKEFGRRRETAPPVIRKVHRPGTGAAPLHGLFAAAVGGRRAVVEYEPDADLRDSETVPLGEEGGIEAFLAREILPYTPDAWYRPESAKTGYRINFNRYFYKPEPPRRLDEIQAEIFALERETRGLLESVLGGEGR